MVYTGFQQMLAESKARRDADARRYEELDGDLCQLCYAYGTDKRNLFMTCLYAIHEVVPEAIDLSGLEDEKLNTRGYYLRICKSCRGRLLGHLQVWRDECAALRNTPKDHDGHPEEEDETRRIYVRINGVSVAMNEDEYAAYEQRKANP